MSVRPAREEDVEPLADVLARAFHDDPVTRWVYAKDASRARWSRRFFRWQLRRLIVQDVTWTTLDRAGAAIWALPDQWRESPSEAFALIRTTVLGVLPRLHRVLPGLTEVERRHPEEPHLYLSVLGVEPDRQGRGVGSALIRPGLELCDREGLPAYLETSRERNVDFYARHGFEVVEELRLPRGPMVWLLWRPGAAS